MRPTVSPPLRIRGLEFGGAQPLFCIPLVPPDLASLSEQARIAAALKPDLIEWRADFFRHQTPERLLEGASVLRGLAADAAIIFTLRAKNEGGAQEIAPATRRLLIDGVLRSNTIDIVDLELANEPGFLDALMAIAKACGVHVLLAMHDFERTPPSDVLSGRIRAMRERGASIAKVAVMPRCEEDLLRLLDVTIRARREYPDLPLCTMSMGRLGSITRVAGFLYGSDMAFAVGKDASAPGQIPIEDARRMTDLLLHYA
jgi:3-dehydroquinate dehydratase-1